IMKRVLIIAVVLFAFQKSDLYAQDLSGVATYKWSREVNFQTDQKMGEEMKKQMKEQLRKHFEREFILAFSVTKSLYSENEKLEAPPIPSNNGMVIKVRQDKVVLFKDIKTKTYTRQEEMMGKMFLIKDSLEAPNWKLEKETKNIGDYLCYKATMEQTDSILDIKSFDRKGEIQKTERTKIITAWYTPQIPISNGPSLYYGLPGLVLEVQDDDLSILCSGIVLNPKEKPIIEEPTKGKVIKEDKFKTLKLEKMREMIERSRGNRKSDDGKSIKLRIGG